MMLSADKLFVKEGTPPPREGAEGQQAALPQAAHTPIHPQAEAEHQHGTALGG